MLGFGAVIFVLWQQTDHAYLPPKIGPCPAIRDRHFPTFYQTAPCALAS
jgi:hypothetical protein